MRPTEKRSTILLNGLWISILAIGGAAFLIVELGHLFLFWVGFVGSFLFGVCNTYFWYLEYTRQLDVRLRSVTLLRTCLLIGFIIAFPLLVLLVFRFPENIETVFVGIGAGIASTLATGPFGVALLYSQASQPRRPSQVTREIAVYNNPKQKSWNLPLDEIPASSHYPASTRLLGGIQDFPFHFVGYDLFFTASEEVPRIHCRVCDSLCVVRRGIYGPLNWRDYNRKIYKYHDSFACPHSTQPWHNRALDLVRQIERIEIPIARQSLIHELRLILRTARYPR
jgi:hypothetical protein